MELAKFVFTAIGTFISVFGICFSIFQYWKKKQDEKIEGLSGSLGKKIQAETERSREAESRLTDRVDKLELSFSREFENRLSRIEGKLEGMNKTLDKIQEWFMGPPRG